MNLNGRENKTIHNYLAVGEGNDTSKKVKKGARELQRSILIIRMWERATKCPTVEHKEEG